VFENKTVAVVVPCYNEQRQIASVLATMPEWVDCVIVVDDASKDATADTAQTYIDRHRERQIVLLRRKANGGVGAAIVEGYREAIVRRMDITAVMAGDGQMPPDELHLLVAPVARGQADYTKGNRLFYRNAWDAIPKYRYLGNAFLSMLTKIASGYWHVADSQTGYTAISLEALETINLDRVYPRYGYPNDLLVRLNVFDFVVADVPIRPVYGVGERSKMKLWKVIPTMSWMIFKRFVWRLKEKYIIHDFHPLVLFYAFGWLSFNAGLLSGLYLVILRFFEKVAPTSALFSVFLFMTGLQLMLFAMWFDMEMNRQKRNGPSREIQRESIHAASEPADSGQTNPALPTPAGRRQEQTETMVK
jgi:glycosyltransferase involved in cell wall biosynthesis